MELIVRCACGWETRGSEEEVILAATEHGRTVHNMTPSRDQVLQMAVSAQGGDPLEPPQTA